MAKKVNTKVSSKTLMSTEVAYLKGAVKKVTAQNEALSEQLSGLQDEVMDLATVNSQLNAVFDEQDDYIAELENQNTALLNSLVEEQFAVQDALDEHDERDKTDQLILSGLGLVLEQVQKLVAERDELKQDNFHLTIQRDALKDKVKILENTRPVVFIKRHQFNATDTIAIRTPFNTVNPY